MRYHYFLSLLFISLSLLSCEDDDHPRIAVRDPNIHTNNSNGEEQEITEIIMADNFAIGVMDNFYLWRDEEGLMENVNNVLDPNICVDPINDVKKVLYPEDHWTMLSDKISDFLNYTDGIELTSGMDVTPYIYDKDDHIIYVVNYVYTDSPADLAGIKRGDIFIKFNGRTVNKNNYKDFYLNDQTFTVTVAQYEKGTGYVETGQEYTITPVELHENPILATNIYHIGDKKVGYIAYRSFTEDVLRLLAIMTQFKEENVSELILDLRYNTGGYSSTCNIFASMIAPVDNVLREDVFSTSIYNKDVAEIYFNNNLDDRFMKAYASSNPDLKKVYFITNANTASASECLIVGLMPYMDVKCIGQKTHGKFCSGFVLEPGDIFIDEVNQKYGYLYGDWGMYVMIGTFANSKNENPCRPDGITPDVDVIDNPFDGYQLGDENESMLRAALTLAGKKYDDLSSTRSLSTLHYDRIEVEKPSIHIRRLPDISR